MRSHIPSSIWRSSRREGGSYAGSRVGRPAGTSTVVQRSEELGAQLLHDVASGEIAAKVRAFE